MDASIVSDDSFEIDATINSVDSSDIDSSINIDETLNGSEVIEDSFNGSTMNDDKTLDVTDEQSIDNDSDDQTEINDSDDESMRSLETSSIAKPSTSTDAQGDLSNVSDDLSSTEKRASSEAHQDSSKFETSEINDSGDESHSTKSFPSSTSSNGKPSTSTEAQGDLGNVSDDLSSTEKRASSEAHQDSNKFETSESNISGSTKPFPSSEVLNISDDDSDDDSVKESHRVYEIDSSDELSIVENADIKPEFNPVKFGSTASFDADVKLEKGVKLESAVASGTEKKFNPSQLVDDVKPIHTGKTGMETFNNQQAMALNCMRKLTESLESKPNENELADIPAHVKIELMPHQRSALTWMLWREEQKPKGGILADDMGLGKTMSMISLVVKKRYMEQPESAGESSDSSDDEEVEDGKASWVAKGSSSKSYYYGGTLVVCPAIIMDQWKAEVKNRLKSNALTVILHHGSNRETRPSRLSKHDMVITTYGIVSSECDNQGALFSLKWERIILDEAHIIRNHTSKQSIACCKLKASARWTLTGTPIQNKEADLYPLLKFLRCRPFDDYSSFKMWISKTSSKSQERLTQVLQALLLRRTKEDLKEIGQIESLPEKTKKIVPVKMTTDEMNVYQKVLFYSQSLFSEYLHQKETRSNFAMATNTERKNEWAQLHQQISKVNGSSGAISAHHILILILRLRQICIHPSLIHAMLSDGEFDEGDSDTENAPEVDLLERLSKLKIGSHDEDNEIASKASSKVLLRSNPVFDEDRVSSKFQKIIEFITEKLIGTGDKGIVVSQFASVLTMFGDHLKPLGIKFVMLTGQTKIESRNDIVTNFNNSNSSIQVMLLSLTAGGVGLNLVGANHLFFVDPHWNPQLENQAQDRIYRLGQKKPVTIYKFLCDDTIERRIQHLQEAKLEMADQVLTGAKRKTSKLTLDDMKTLFDL